MSPRLSLNEDDLGPLFSLDHEIPAFDRLCATRDETLSRRCTVSFESRVHRAMTLKSATNDGVTECELVVEREMCSDRKAMHGSCGSCIIDLATCSSLCCLARPGFWAIPAPGYNGTKGWFAGVTRNLAITWVTPVRMGERLRVRCEVVSVTGRNAVVRCETWVMREGEGKGRLAFFGMHELVSLVKTLGSEVGKGKKGKQGEKMRERGSL